MALKEFIYEGSVDGKNTKMRVFAQTKGSVPDAVRKETGGRSVTVRSITEV